jgi:hypothetical protein
MITSRTPFAMSLGVAGAAALAGAEGDVDPAAAGLVLHPVVVAPMSTLAAA